MDLNRFTQSPDSIPWIAVFIQRNPPPYNNLHAGIAYRDAKDSIRLLHLGWHRHLIHEACRGDIGFSIPVFDPLELADELFLAGFCGKIARSGKNRDIPYNLKIDPDVTFDLKSGDIQLGMRSTGLGCATFVVAVFRSSGNAIVDTTNWPAPDADDIAMQQSLVDSLARSSDADYQAQALRIAGEIGAPRARPEHVTGSCLEAVFPVTHATCNTNGAAIVAILDNWSIPNPPSP